MKKFLFIVLSFLLSGCDPFYGVNRSFQVDQINDQNCIEEALKKVGEVKDVSYKSYEGAQYFTLTGSSKPSKIFSYSYSIAEIEDNYLLHPLHVEFKYNQTVKIQHGFGNILARPPQKEVDIVLPVMKKIETSIGKTCGFKNLESEVSELCVSVNCE